MRKRSVVAESLAVPVSKLRRLVSAAPSRAETMRALTSYTGLKTKFASTSEVVPVPSKVAMSPAALLTVSPSAVTVPVTSMPVAVVASFWALLLYSLVAPPTASI